MKPLSEIKTIHEFVDWCEAFPDIKFYELLGEACDNAYEWRWAIASNIDIEADSSQTAGTLLLWLSCGVKILGPELLDDIQRTYDER